MPVVWAARAGGRMTVGWRPCLKTTKPKGWGQGAPAGSAITTFPPYSNLVDKIIILRSEGEKKAPLSHEEVSSSLSDFGPFA